MPRPLYEDSVEKYAEDPDDKTNSQAMHQVSDELAQDPLTVVRQYMEHQKKLEHEAWERGEIDPQEYEKRKKSWSGMENMYRRETRKRMAKKKYVGGADRRLPPTNPDPGPEIEYKEEPAEKPEPPPRAVERPSVGRGDERIKAPQGHATYERMVVPLSPEIMKGIASGAPMSKEVLEAIKSLRGKYDFNPYE